MVREGPNGGVDMQFDGVVCVYLHLPDRHGLVLYRRSISVCRNITVSVQAIAAVTWWNCRTMICSSHILIVHADYEV